MDSQSLQMLRMIMIFSLACIVLSSLMSLTMRDCSAYEYEYFDKGMVKVIYKNSSADLTSLNRNNTQTGARAEKFIFTTIDDRTIFRISIVADLYNLIEPSETFTVLLDSIPIGNLYRDIDGRYKLTREFDDLSMYNLKKVTISQNISGRVSNVMEGEFVHGS